MIVFEPTFMTIFVSNSISQIDNNDHALNERIKHIYFPIDFCDNCIDQMQTRHNSFIYEKVYSWQIDFMLLLIEYYKKIYA
jgi:hypothetical protein